MADNKISIGLKLAESRREKKLTQEELANRIGVTAQALSQYERGLRYPDVEILKALCNVLDISSDYLLEIENKRITEMDNPKIQNEIWKNLRNTISPLSIVFGEELVSAFENGRYKNLIDELRLRFSKDGILIPLVRVMDWQILKPREFMVLSYHNVLHQEIILEEQEISTDYIVDRFGEIVQTRYADILNIEIIKSLIDNLRVNHAGLIDGEIPNKISYGLILNVCKKYIQMGNSMVYFPQIIELLVGECRQEEEKDCEELVSIISEKIGSEDNIWIWLHKHEDR